ncbi:MAG: PKD domain-containing protein, partial [Planctomycetes bacterium]|nr:PKD domain-containing protein [Planctomycetota bacterium]
MIKNLCPAAIAMFAVASSLVAQTGNQVTIPPHNNVYNGFSRGYSFTAGGDFFIQDTELPLDAQQVGDTAGVRISVNGTEVFYSVGNAAAIMTPPAPIQIFTGDLVEVVGNWSPATTGNFSAHNSYGLSGPFATTIEGVATNLDRAGVQWDIGDPGYATAGSFNGLTGSLGRVWIYTTPPAGLFASFSASPSTGASPLSVTFTDTSFTSDPGGVTSWAWDFDGDGVIDSTNSTDTFVYPACGSYDVTLTVTDATHPTSTTTVVGAVVVDQVVADFTVAEIAPGTGLWQFTDTSAPTPTSWAWDFDGDGTVDDTNQNPVYFDPSLSPILSLPTCTLTVTGQGGCFSDTLVRSVSATGYGVANGPMGGGNGTAGTPAVGTYWDISVGVAEGLTINGAECGVYGFAGTADVR